MKKVAILGAGLVTKPLADYLMDKCGHEVLMATMRVEGIPNGDSAMSRAVSLPAAIASKLILSGELNLKGVYMPTLPEIYNPVLSELATFGFKFQLRKKLV